jgi:hypothetical protein
MNIFFNPNHLFMPGYVWLRRFITLFLISLLTQTELQAQTNTFPASGNVGIDITNIETPLCVRTVAI